MLSQVKKTGKEWDEWWVVVLWEKTTIITMRVFSLLCERKGGMFSPPWIQMSVDPKGGKGTLLFYGLRGEDPTQGFWAWNIFPVLHPRRLPIQGATAVKWTLVVQWWELRKKLSYSHVAHTGECATEKEALQDTRHTKILMPAIQITSTICLVSQRNNTANKIQLKSRSVCFVPTTIPPLLLSLKEPF